MNLFVYGSRRGAPKLRDPGVRVPVTDELENRALGRAEVRAVPRTGAPGPVSQPSGGRTDHDNLVAAKTELPEHRQGRRRCISPARGSSQRCIPYSHCYDYNAAKSERQHDAPEVPAGAAGGLAGTSGRGFRPEVPKSARAPYPSRRIRRMRHGRRSSSTASRTGHSSRRSRRRTTGIRASSPSAATRK